MIQEMKKYQAAEEAYKQLFGPHSLDRVVLLDPLRAEAKDYQDATQQLQEAMKSGVPLPQSPEEIWKTLIF